MKRFSRLLLALSFSLILSLPFVVLANSLLTNLIQNDGFETFYDETHPHRDDERVITLAENWHDFWIEDVDDTSLRRIRYYTSCQWNVEAGGPAGFCEKQDGAEAQVIWTSSSNPFDVGMYQQISGLTVGESYGFQVGTLQVFESTTNRQDGKMKRRIGVDPTGGTDPSSDKILWSPIDTVDTIWFYGSVGTKAEATTMTVFIRFLSSGEGDGISATQIWIDNAYFDIAPVDTQLSVAYDTKRSSTKHNSANEVTATATWSGSPRDGFVPYAYEAQYCELPDGQETCDDSWETTWQELQVFQATEEPPTATSAQFTVDTTKIYLVRARTWHRVETPDRHEVAGPWTVEKLGGVTKGNLISLVKDNQGQPFFGAKVTATGSETATTTTGQDGIVKFELPVGDYTVTASATNWDLKTAVTTTVTDTANSTVTLTLIPADNVVQNGDFEDEQTNWQTTITNTSIISRETNPVNKSLCLGSSGVLSQSHTLSNAYQPTLSFWYNISDADGSTSLSAEIIGRNTLTQTTPLTFATNTTGWMQAVLALNLAEYELPDDTPILPVPDRYTGPIEVRFTVNGSGPTFCLDDVVVGSSQIAPQQIFLPLVVKMNQQGGDGTGNLPTCPTTSSNTYALISAEGDKIDHPDKEHGDLNLSLRGYEDRPSAELSFQNYSGNTATDGPKLTGTLNRVPTFNSAAQVYDWKWDCETHGCKGDILSSAVNPAIQWDTTLLGFETTRGENIYIPTRNDEIFGGGYKALVLYAEENRITLGYTRQDTVANGYSVHIEGLCVDANLLALYKNQVKSDGYRQDSHQLPGLKNTDIIGTALGGDIKIAIRDKGVFMDPRSQKDWW